MPHLKTPRYRLDHDATMPPPPSSALGPAHNLLESPGVSGAAFFALSHLTPRHEDWAWDDSPAVPETRSQHLALAGYFGQAGVAAAVRGWVEAVYVPPDSSDVVAMNYPVALLYFTALGSPADVAALQRHAHFAAQHTFSVRSSWSDPGASFIAWQVWGGAARGGGSALRHAPVLCAGEQHQLGVGARASSWRRIRLPVPRAVVGAGPRPRQLCVAKRPWRWLPPSATRPICPSRCAATVLLGQPLRPLQDQHTGAQLAHV